jgi:hypothetical protein
MLRFTYTDALGRTDEWVLTRWKETSRYIQGRSEHDALPRTFRKDRVQEYLEGAELLLMDAAPPSPAPAPRAQPDARPQILFTGFKAADRARLEQFADEHGFRVMKVASKALAVLCGGYNAGPAKIEAARAAGAFILTEEQLYHLVLTGEISC